VLLFERIEQLSSLADNVIERESAEEIVDRVAARIQAGAGVPPVAAAAAAPVAGHDDGVSSLLLLRELLVVVEVLELLGLVELLLLPQQLSHMLRLEFLALFVHRGLLVALLVLFEPLSEPELLLVPKQNENKEKNITL
jgi:hypothetical protein